MILKAYIIHNIFIPLDVSTPRESLSKLKRIMENNMRERTLQDKYKTSKSCLSKNKDKRRHLDTTKTIKAKTVNIFKTKRDI